MKYIIKQVGENKYLQFVGFEVFLKSKKLATRFDSEKLALHESKFQEWAAPYEIIEIEG